MFGKTTASQMLNQQQNMKGSNIREYPSKSEREEYHETHSQKKNTSIGVWTKEDTIEKYAYMNILGNPRILRLRKTNKEFAEDFNYYYSLLDDIAENMLEFRIYWDMMMRLLNKYDII